MGVNDGGYDGSSLGMSYLHCTKKQITSSLHPRLKEAEDARTLCVSIENVECSGPLREALLQHASSMTELYRTLNQMVADGIADENSYSPIFERASNYSNWYKSRKRVANSMRAAASSAA